MGHILPEEGLSIKQLLHTLREQLAYTIQHKPPGLTLEEVREYEEDIKDLLIHARHLANSFDVTVRMPPEILATICSYLGTEEGMFSASQVCHHWREVLISSPYLWTRLPCRCVFRTIIGLERSKSMPVQLGLSRQWSNPAVEKVLLHGNKVTSLNLRRSPGRFSIPDQLFTFSRPSVERLYIYQEMVSRLEDWEKIHELWQPLPSLRELFVHQYPILIDRLAAPNLTHLALDEAGNGWYIAVQSILDALRGCPLLETLFIAQKGISRDPTHDYSPVSLPHLRSIELGASEVNSGLITLLMFPSNVAVGFRMRYRSDWPNGNSLVDMATIQHVLGRVDVRCIILAGGSPGDLRDRGILVRLEWLCGSLEITYPLETDMTVRDIVFGPSGALFSHCPSYTENTRELHIVGSLFEGDRELRYIHDAMPNLVSISFFRYEGPHVFGLLTPTNPSSPPFPHLERVMILGPESGLREIVKTRKDCGVPLKTLIFGRGSGLFEYDHENHAALREFVDDLRVECPTEILEWGTENEVLNIWSAADMPGPYVLGLACGLFKFCRFEVSG